MTIETGKPLIDRAGSLDHECLAMPALLRRWNPLHPGRRPANPSPHLPTSRPAACVVRLRAKSEDDAEGAVAAAADDDVDAEPTQQRRKGGRGPDKKERKARRLTAKHRDRLSSALKGKPKPETFMDVRHRAKIGAANRNRTKPSDFMDQEHREKISKSLRESWARRKAERAAQSSSGDADEGDRLADEGQTAASSGESEVMGDTRMD